MKQKTVTQVELAEILGVSQPAVHKYIKQGKIPESCIVKEGRHKKIKLKDALAELTKSLDPSRSKQKQAQGDDAEQAESDASITLDTGISFAEAQRLDKLYSAELKNLELEEKKGKLINAEEVREAAFTKARTVRDAILNIPDRISATLAAESDQIAVSKLLMDELVQALEDLC